MDDIKNPTPGRNMIIINNIKSMYSGKELTFCHQADNEILPKLATKLKHAHTLISYLQYRQQVHTLTISSRMMNSPNTKWVVPTGCRNKMCTNTGSKHTHQNHILIHYPNTAECVCANFLCYLTNYHNYYWPRPKPIPALEH